MAVLIDFDCDENTDQIYNNDSPHNHNDSDLSPDSSGLREDKFQDPTWGVYPFKPLAQDIWNTSVSKALLAAAAVEVDDPALTAGGLPAHSGNPR